MEKIIKQIEELQKENNDMLVLKKAWEKSVKNYFGMSSKDIKKLIEKNEMRSGVMNDQERNEESDYSFM